jgi:phosphatidylserine/phosphatidylglycerophosphate/cardiolipin synthase-like enzyme
MGGCLARIAGLGLVAALAAGGYHYMRVHRPVFVGNALLSRRAPLTWRGSKHDGAEHFSPGENLERLELSELRAAAERARDSAIPLRIAIYSFTDRAIAKVLLGEADRGTVVELYRDGEQYETEERNGARFRDGSVTSLFRGHRNIHVRVKPALRSDLMHLKAWTDGTVLREGSANWSPVGLKRQDNNLRFTESREEVKAFLSDFDALWNRPANLVIQL